MDYSSSAYHPYAEVYRRPLAKPFPQGVALGTTGVPTRSAAARLLDIEHDFPGKFERRAELDRLKSKRRLEANDYGMLPYNSWSTYLKPSTPPRHYYSPQYAYCVDSPSSPIVISRFPVRPLRMVQLAPLSVRCLPMPEQNADALTLELEADDARFQSQQAARRCQSSIWQSEATDRAIRLCKDRNRIRNQLRRIENARLVGPIWSRLGSPEQLGTRQKVLINYHKGAKSDAAQKSARDEESHETPKHLPSKTHEDVVKVAEVQQADESQRSQQSAFSVEEQRREEPEPQPVEPEPEPEPEKQTIPSHEEEQEPEKEVAKEKEKKPKKEHKYETAKEKRRREQQEKKAAEQKEEKIIEPELPKVQKTLEPLTLKIKEEKNEKAAVEPASPGVTETFVLPKPKAKKEIEPESPKIRESITIPASPIVKEEAFEPTSPKIRETSAPSTPVFQPDSPKIFEETKPLSLKIKRQTSELIENVPASPKIEGRQTPLQSPSVNQEQPALVAETAAVPISEPEPEPEPQPDPEPDITTEKEPELTEVYETKDDKVTPASSPAVRDEPPQFEKQKSIEDESPKLESQKSVDEQPPQYESQRSVEDQPPHYDSQKSVEDQPLRSESQASFNDQPPQLESQKSVEEVTETISLDEPLQDPVDIARQTSVTSAEFPAEESTSVAEDVAPVQEPEDQDPQSPTVLRRLISNVSNVSGEACDPAEWDADDGVEVELPSERKGIILSASDNAIPDRGDHHEAEEDADTPAVTTEEPSTEGTDTVVWARGNNVECDRLSTGRADELTDLSASTNENAEAGSALTGDNAEETLSANGRPLSVDAESLAADDEQILDDALETTYSMHDRNLEPRVEEPDEETYKYDENVEYRSKSISIEEDE